VGFEKTAHCFLQISTISGFGYQLQQSSPSFQTLHIKLTPKRSKLKKNFGEKYIDSICFLPFWGLDFRR